MVVLICSGLAFLKLLMTHACFPCLQVGKYIPDVERCKQPTWDGVLEAADVLDEMFQEYIAEPLRKQAIPSTQASPPDLLWGKSPKVLSAHCFIA